MICFDTPVEEYSVDGRVVWVKRDDLFLSAPAPGLGKLRGLVKAMDRLRKDCQFHVGCFEASKSKVGHAVAAVCSIYEGFECTVVYPQFGRSPIGESVSRAKTLGAAVAAVRGNHVPINHFQAKRIVEARGGWMIPFGFEFPESIEAVALEAASLGDHLVMDGTVVVPSGSGVTLAGVSLGLAQRPRRIIGVSVGRSVAGIMKCLDRWGVNDLSRIDIIGPEKRYSEPAEGRVPFPCDPYYDQKAWNYLRVCINEFDRGPVLFWNVGS